MCILFMHNFFNNKLNKTLTAMIYTMQIAKHRVTNIICN